MNILICNVGSTSLKYQLFAMEQNEKVLAAGGAERVGAAKSLFYHTNKLTNESQKYEALFQKLLTNYASDEPFSKASCYSLLYQIYEQIVHDQNTAYLTESARQIIEAARSFVLANLSDPSLSVAQIARHVQISEGHLRRLFHQKYGISPMKYIVEARMKKAKALLELEGIQICDVARQVGYSSSAYFCSIFHSMTGITPARYRQMYL